MHAIRTGPPLEASPSHFKVVCSPGVRHRAVEEEEEIQPLWAARSPKEPVLVHGWATSLDCLSRGPLSTYFLLEGNWTCGWHPRVPLPFALGSLRIATSVGAGWGNGGHGLVLQRAGPTWRPSNV